MTARKWTAGRLWALVFAGVLTLVSLVPLAVGGYALFAEEQDGYVAEDSGSFSVNGYAATGEEWNAADAFFGTVDSVRIEFTPDDEVAPVFVGYATVDNAREYLSGMEHTTVHRATTSGGPTETHQEGSAPSVMPGEAEIWAFESEGVGTQVLYWDTDEHDETLVPIAMNADGTPALGGTVALSYEIPALGWIGVGGLAAGALILGAAAMLAVRTVKAVRRAVQST